MSSDVCQHMPAVKLLLEMNKIRMGCLEDLAQRASDEERAMARERDVHVSKCKALHEEKETLLGEYFNGLGIYVQGRASMCIFGQT